MSEPQQEFEKLLVAYRNAVCDLLDALRDKSSSTGEICELKQNEFDTRSAVLTAFTSRPTPTLEGVALVGWMDSEPFYSGLYRAALKGWKRGRRNQDPAASTIASLIRSETKIAAVPGRAALPPSLPDPAPAGKLVETIRKYLDGAMRGRLHSIEGMANDIAMICAAPSEIPSNPPAPGPQMGNMNKWPDMDAVEIARALTLLNSAPERIFFNLGPPDSLEDPCVFDDLNSQDVTWSVDKIENFDIEYIRADLAHSPASPDSPTLQTEGSGIWDIASKYAALHDKILGTSCGCDICNEYGSLDWNKNPAPDSPTGAGTTHPAHSCYKTGELQMGSAEDCPRNCTPKTKPKELGASTATPGRLRESEYLLALRLCEAVNEYIAADGSKPEQSMSDACAALEKRLHDFTKPHEPARPAPQSTPGPRQWTLGFDRTHGVQAIDGPIFGSSEYIQVREIEVQGNPTPTTRETM